MSEPKWLEIARGYIGVTEVPGAATSPTIHKWLVALKAPWQEDATPWCGTFVAECFREAGGIALARPYYRAKAWLDWGIPIMAPIVGCVVVYERVGGGHVGFVVGRDAQGRLMTLGGNQRDAVNIAPFDMARVAGYRWPMEFPITSNLAPLPMLAANGMPASKNEA